MLQKMPSPRVVMTIGLCLLLLLFAITKWPKMFRVTLDREMVMSWQGKHRQESLSSITVLKIDAEGGEYRKKAQRQFEGGLVHFFDEHQDETEEKKTKEMKKKPALEERLCYQGSLDGPGHFSPCKAEQPLRPRQLPVNASVIETHVLPFETKLLPEIGNGHVATVIQSSAIYMNGLYNGGNITSHRARIPSRAAVLVKVVSPSGNMTQLFRLDVGRGVFSEVYKGSGFSVEVRRYAHRELSRLLVTELVVQRTTSTLPITLSLDVNTGGESEDIDFVQKKPGIVTGRTKVAEYPSIHGTVPVTVVYTNVPPVLTFLPSKQGSVVFLTSVSPDTMDALNYFNEGMTRFKQGRLFSSHVKAWDTVWQQGRIEMTGNDSLALLTNAAMYYLLTALPLKPDSVWPFVGMAPGGLAHGGAKMDYNGHVFWDQDTWMFPPIALLHSDLGRTIVGTRVRTLGTARLHANMSGYKGARYPWESAFTGLPTSPSKGTSVYEIHVTGDVAWMLRQYLQLTNDTQFLTAGDGYKALVDIANFWMSRSVYNSTKAMYEILRVMGPDEHHYNINNSVFTNMIAAQSLRTAQFAAALSHQTPDPRWEEVASRMYIHFDKKYNYHPEFDTYTIGTEVKQADVVLLGFPFRWPMNPDLRWNDLSYYSKVTPAGPAMTWSISSVNYLRLGVKDKADSTFYHGMRNVQEPFKVWSENADGTGAYNFHTGMGGFLQSFLFGYLGVDLNDNSLDLDPQLPPSLTSMTVRGVDYLCGSLDVAYNDNQMNVTLTKAAVSPLLLLKQKQLVMLKVGSVVTMTRERTSIRPQV